jgi:DNA-binding NarL/FixJ family response regulator
MFQKVLIAEDMDFINSGIKSQLSELGIPQIEYVQYCDEALLKLKCAKLLDKEPYDLLISDLSFVNDHLEQKLNSGDELIKAVRKEFPFLKIIVFSVEDKIFRIQSLFNDQKINGYVWKSRDGLRELKQAIQTTFNSKASYISPHCSNAMIKGEAIEIADYDLFLINCLSKGFSQEKISEELHKKKWTPTSISSIEKRLKFLREQFNANNPAHLVSIAKDLGLI